MTVMKRICRFCVPVVLLITLCPNAALADTEVVDGVTEYYDSTDVLDNLVIKNGGRAYVFGSTVEGNITVEGDGSHVIVSEAWVGKNVTAEDGGAASVEYTIIEGSLQGDGAAYMNLWQSTINRHLQMAYCGSFAGYISEVGGNVSFVDGGNPYFHNFHVGGNMEVTGNVGHWWAYAGVIYSDVGGNLKVTGNQVMNLTVHDNTIEKNLQITDNTPMPTIFDNVVFRNEIVD